MNHVEDVLRVCVCARTQAARTHIQCCWLHLPAILFMFHRPHTLGPETDGEDGIMRDLVRSVGGVNTFGSEGRGHN